MNILIWVVMVLAGISCLLASLVFVKHLLNGKTLYSKNTNNRIAELLQKEKEIYNQIHKEIKEAGIINRYILKKKLGPLYRWYEGGYLSGENNKA